MKAQLGWRQGSRASKDWDEVAVLTQLICLRPDPNRRDAHDAPPGRRRQH